MVARAQRWSTGHTTRVALWTGVGHVVGSLALGVIIMALGYGLQGILRVEGPIVGIVLVVSGIGLFLWSQRHRGHSHSHSHPHPHPHPHPHHHGEEAHHPSDPLRRRSAWLIPAGIAASPDATILPVFLAAVAVSVRTAIEVSVVYAVVTILAITGLSLAATWGGYQVKWTWLEQHASHVTSAVLIALGIAAWAAL